MDGRVQMDDDIQVVLVLSEQPDDKSTETESTQSESFTDKQDKLTIRVIPIVNFVVVGSNYVTIDELEIGGNQLICVFMVKATHVGRGEVWISASRGQVSVALLRLSSKIVAANKPVKTRTRGRLRKTKAGQRDSSYGGGVKERRSQSELSGAQARDEAQLPTSTPLKQPLHQLWIFERRTGNDILYEYVFQSPSLGVADRYESKVITHDRGSYVENLYKQIEEEWIKCNDRTEFMAELRALGGELLDSLIPERLQRVLWENRDAIESIMVISTEPFIPWELLHLKDPDQRHLPTETRFLGQMGLVRWLHDAGWPPDTLAIRNGRAYYAIPQYRKPDRLPETLVEREFLEREFNAAAVDARSNAVRDLIENGDFDLLHFAGHGEAAHDNVSDSRLMLEGTVKKRQYAPTFLSARVVQHFGNMKTADNRPMIVLNACEVGRLGYGLTDVAGFAQAFLQRGAGVFVGPLWSVGDSPASTFVIVLYKELVRGKNMAQASIKAREAARATGDATWLAYAVYGHPHLRIAR